MSRVVFRDLNSSYQHLVAIPTRKVKVLETKPGNIVLQLSYLVGNVVLQLSYLVANVVLCEQVNIDISVCVYLPSVHLPPPILYHLPPHI